MKHLPNRELGILDSSTDFFGHIYKGDAIASFLSSNIESMNQSNMIALYGKWGSGKSTLMRYIGTKLEKGDFKSLYFPAWEYEKDENLPLSLLHFISDETKTSKIGVVKDLLKLATNASLSALKSITIDAGVVKINPKLFIDSAKEDFEKEKDKSTYNTTKEFKKKFIQAEKEIVSKLSKKKLIIFIDDLDRCEPENVLNLISIIKLFFTYSENIIFLFGCDKDAISKAVQHKYGDVIKADEYLEKVIDVSFNMPNDISINKLLYHYFPNDITLNGEIKNTSLFLEHFFQSINFTNPRQLKKVLNKFEIIQNFKNQTNSPLIQSDLIPNIIIDNTGDLIETVFVLFFIVIYEFYQETFSDLFNYDKKIITYANALIEDSKRRNNTSSLALSTAIAHVQTNGSTLKSLSYSFKDINKSINNLVISNELNQKEKKYNSYLSVFSPSNYTNKYNVAEIGMSFISQFYDDKNSEGEKKTLKFCEYLWEIRSDVLMLKSDYKMIDFFRMCQILL